ncbi:hypothetical protein pipiens_009563 [Culex pipiens pipiens]|uniref:Uncharacterized protein n=1 Tax=Culex pipiens pipiens TaxID=38569 RepID=A0ABD1DDM4_CULPP
MCFCLPPTLIHYFCSGPERPWRCAPDDALYGGSIGGIDPDYDDPEELDELGTRCGKYRPRRVPPVPVPFPSGGDILRGIIPLDVDWTELERTQQQNRTHRQTAV